MWLTDANQMLQLWWHSITLSPKYFLHIFWHTTFIQLKRNEGIFPFLRLNSHSLYYILWLTHYTRCLPIQLWGCWLEYLALCTQHIHTYKSTTRIAMYGCDYGYGSGDFPFALSISPSPSSAFRRILSIKGSLLPFRTVENVCIFDVAHIVKTRIPTCYMLWKLCKSTIITNLFPFSFRSQIEYEAESERKKMRENGTHNGFGVVKR